MPLPRFFLNLRIRYKLLAAYAALYVTALLLLAVVGYYVLRAVGYGEVVQTMGLLLLAMGGALLLLIVPVSLWISDTITRPLQVMTRTIRSMAEGDFSARMDYRSRDEIGQLSSFFNDYMVTLDSYGMALRESEETYRGIFENAVVGIFQATPEGRLQSANPAMARMLGHDTPEELLAAAPDMAATVYARPEDWAAALDELERTGRVAGQEAQWRRSDGGQFWASLAMNRVSDASGSSHFEGTVLDVSERKEAEQELARYRDHLEEMVQERTRDLAAAKRKMEELHALQGLILDNSQAGIALVKDRAFEWANARWAAILGREQQDLENASTRLLYPDDATYEMVGRESLEALRQGRAWDREVELVRADGTPFWGRLIGSSLVPGEPDQGIIWLLEDVTERHAMEEKLRQRQRRLTEALQSLKRAQRELGEKNAALESVSGQLAKYLPPQVYTSIFAGHQEAQVGATRKKLTVFFSDIVGFTSATDGMEPEDITTALNAYLNAMSRIVLDHGGTLDKFIGDAIMVFFGDPESQGYKEDAVACVSMALAMRSSLKGLQAYWNELGVRHPFHVRMGISTGYCTVGNFGSDQRMDYTIIGGQVNLASRLESMAGPGQVLISHETWSLVKDVFHCVRKDPVSVKGIAQPVQTYEVVDFHENIKTEKKKIKDHRTGFTLSMRPERIAEEDREDILAVLREAMESLDKE